jgi:hypothetical protein
MHIPGWGVTEGCAQTASAIAKGVHAPFRQHSLTANLKAALDGSCRTTVVAHVSPVEGQLDELVSTLRFAEHMRRITTNAKVAELAEPEMLLRRYERQVSRCACIVPASEPQAAATCLQCARIPAVRASRPVCVRFTRHCCAFLHTLCTLCAHVSSAGRAGEGTEAGAGHEGRAQWPCTCDVRRP